MGWIIHQMDLKTNFLNVIIEEEVYIEKPQDFEVIRKESHVCRPKKYSYALKQVLKSWYSKIDGYL
jgi:hypothetical protein